MITSEKNMPLHRVEDFRLSPRCLVSKFCAAYWIMLLCLLPVSAWALTDPTKPAIDMGASPVSAAVPESNRLRTIIISPARRAAIIDGQTVELGAKHGDVRLIEVSESGVVLQGEQGRQVLTLFPGVNINKKMVLPPPETAVPRPAAQLRAGAARKKMRVKVKQEMRANRPASQAGTKEEK